jgi:hypothetical protein
MGMGLLMWMGMLILALDISEHSFVIQQSEWEFPL